MSSEYSSFRRKIKSSHKRSALNGESMCKSGLIAPIGTLTFMGLLSNLYTRAGMPFSLVASRTCCHHASKGSAPEPYLLHSIYHLPIIRSGRCFSLVCSNILLMLFFKPKSLVKGWQPLSQKRHPYS